MTGTNYYGRLACDSSLVDSMCTFTRARVAQSAEVADGELQRIVGSLNVETGQ